MASTAQSEITNLKAEIVRLKAENAYLRKKLDKKQTHIQQLEDAALTISERKILLARKLPAN
ncbi:MAG: hypothetical protein GX994_02180 [Firmicutes bacterium]|nr:hypothetical protein [Bacillota bacterium]